MTDYQTELNYLEEDAREMLEDEMKTWPSCDAGHPMHPDALTCDTCQYAIEMWRGIGSVLGVLEEQVA